MAASSGALNKMISVVFTAVFSGPNRWWFGRRLNRGRLRWFGEHFTPVTGLQDDFLSHTLSVVPVGDRHDSAPLLRGILLDALLRDLDRLTRRKRFIPHRRRRQ
jgi:hypothetical protein